MLCYKFQYECSKLFQINPPNETFLWVLSFFSLHLLHGNHLFFMLSFSLSLWNNNKKKKQKNKNQSCPLHHHICSLWQGAATWVRPGVRWEASGGAARWPTLGLWWRSLHQCDTAAAGRFLHDCTRLRVYKDKKWSFNANFFHFPQRSFRALGLSQCCSFLLWRRDVSVTSSPPENISHHAAV